MGMKTGLPLAVVGTSTYGVKGGFLDARFLDGRIAVRLAGGQRLFSSMLLAVFLDSRTMSAVHLTIGTVWAIAAALDRPQRDHTTWPKSQRSCPCSRW